MKKGFTLVEMLAVIVILSVLILLALPQVLKIMETAKKNSFKNEALAIIKATELKYANQVMDGQEAPECYNYQEDNNELEGYMQTKRRYNGYIIRNKQKFTIYITNGIYTIKGLSKDNANDGKGNLWELNEEELDILYM